ncbi:MULTISPECIES: alcohol dehydrogenase catalytic domain-containing protein [Lachnospiraceae]|jgi:2-desacetyl-2-hydroxyethyl bacteriochlorophyllide A dehydrogenase|uniref:Alcohol dehydrogenase catalytic domain-containing protein n=1 Tax=Faecalicatena acetigenes TaxID=2981790 RepID=A0ABT2TD84_9FIRM|nr:MULTISPECIES: alcohol dehydrogenase catalytic domain-containing protein [Lachnospiraceae]MCU6748202.1 alcohol dehydrogenase catalytic domain-containing protein [Faecalicatena acetigenes]RGT73075.1 Zn-dependent alcohol dehydrogenase [Ruminococcus sp. AF18-22]SCI31603.1 Sorbitol dehydrogenase [uncultured Clostridium sp.]
MKGIQIIKPGELKVIEMEKPVITEKNNILVKMKAAGICGSDVGIYHGTNAAATYPRVIGHEMVGVVEEVGTNATHLKPGDRVIIDQVVNCGHCYACRKGRGNVCGNLKVRGVHIDGGYREYMAVPEQDCYVLPEGLSDTEAVMIEPTTIAIQSCSRAELCEEDTLLLLGCGALGSSILKIAKLSKAKIIVADIVEEKLQEALKNGADYAIHIGKEDVVEKAKELTDGYGPTVSIDAACTKDSLLTLLQATGNAGRVMTMGFSIAPTEVNQFAITSKELDVRGSRLQNKKFQTAIDLIKEGKLDLSGTISHTYPFEKAQEAFDFIDTKDPSIRKIVLTFA